MWDRHYWYVAHQSSRDQRRASRQAYRAARRGYRHNHYYRKGPARFFVILFIILIIAAVSHEGMFPLIPLVIIGSLVFMWLRRSMLRSGGFSGSNSNYQQPNQYYQPPQQPNQYYQPPASPQPNTPPYRPYEQGYQGAQNDYQQGVQPYQDSPAQPASERYEEPQAQYPQEMPPMI
jgi:hypothetical protein